MQIFDRQHFDPLTAKTFVLLGEIILSWTRSIVRCASSREIFSAILRKYLPKNRILQRTRLRVCHQNCDKSIQKHIVAQNSNGQYDVDKSHADLVRHFRSQSWRDCDCRLAGKLFCTFNEIDRVAV
jgi:hypothetical protein